MSESFPLIKWSSLVLVVSHTIFAVLTTLNQLFHANLNFALFLLAVLLILVNLFGLYSLHKENFNFVAIFVLLSGILVIVDAMVPLAPHSQEYAILITVLGAAMVYMMRGQIAVDPV